MDKERENILMEKSVEVEDLIAELCLGAPSEAVKFCLRNYNYSNSLTQIEKDFDREKAQTLRDTAQYLKIPNYELKTKKPLAHLIICRIQNLLPENCSLCDERYRIKLDETPLLECAICGQGVHKQCWSELARAMRDANDPIKLDADSFKAIYNPLNLPGLYFICKVCEDSTIPNDANGNSKRKAKGASQKGKQSNQIEVETISESPGNKDGEENDNQIPEIEITDEEQSIQGNSDNLEKESETANLEDQDGSVRNAEHEAKVDTEHDTQADATKISCEGSKKSPATCHFFKKGNCKHGLKGKDCNFTHPKVCMKYTQHGSRQPRGCNLGKACNDYHPKMCISSLRKGECFSQDCRFSHVKGTKRLPPVIKSNHDQQVTKSLTQPGGGDTKGDTGSFLEVIRLMKTEIMQTLEQRLSSITNQLNQQLQINPPMQRQFPPGLNRPQMDPSMFRPPPMFMMPNQPAILPNQQSIVIPHQQTNQPPNHYRMAPPNTDLNQQTAQHRAPTPIQH